VTGGGIEAEVVPEGDDGDVATAIVPGRRGTEKHLIVDPVLLDRGVGIEGHRHLKGPRALQASDVAQLER
jgi:hypothetical protein